MDVPEVVVDFYGVYLLYCINPKYSGRTYIGYTRDPCRRISQHNRGTWAGGAWRTSNRGPWKMVLIVHGFPNNIAALRFEWAWQHPDKTTRLHHVTDVKKIPRKETEFQYRLRILSEMLRVGPWCRLPLTVRWLHREYFEEFPTERSPPGHMPICHGPVKCRNISKRTNKKDSPPTMLTMQQCSICTALIQSLTSQLQCSSNKCKSYFHLSCLADVFLISGDYVPILGHCPKCSTDLKWGDLIRKMKCGDFDVRNASTDDNEESADDVELSQTNEDMDVAGDAEIIFSQVDDDVLPVDSDDEII